MDERRNSGETSRGSGLGWRLWAYYVNAGAVLAVLKAVLLVWAERHQGAATRWAVYSAFYPEVVLRDWLPSAVTGTSRMEFFAVFGPLLTIVSYAMATPVFLFGWLMHRPGLGRRVVVCYLSAGTAMAMVRVAELVLSVSQPFGTTDGQSLHWALYPEVLLSIHSHSVLGWMDDVFVYGTLLAIGSYVMATPILLVGWVIRRRRGIVEPDRTEPQREPLPPPSTRPKVVTVAILLYYAASIGFVFGVTHADYRTVLLTGLFMAFVVVTCHFSAVRHRWARILLLLNGAVSFLMLEGIGFDVLDAAQAGRPISLARGLHQAVTPAMYAVTVVASSLLLLARARTWYRGGRPQTAGSSPRTLGWTTLTILLSLLAVGGFRYREWTSHTLPAAVVVEIRTRLAGLRSDAALGFQGGTIYRDVRTRWPQLSVRQRFEAASLIGNAVGVNAEYYLFYWAPLDEPPGPLERRGLFEHPAFGVSDTSQNLPDPR
jgi:hypothetical protein